MVIDLQLDDIVYKFVLVMNCITVYYCFCWTIGLFLYNKQNNTWMLVSMKFLSHVEQEILLINFQIHFIFPHIHVLFNL